MFDKYEIKATRKINGEVLHCETVLLYGVFMTAFVGGFGDPYRGHARWTYEKTSEGYLTKMGKKFLTIFKR